MISLNPRETRIAQVLVEAGINNQHPQPFDDVEKLIKQMETDGFAVWRDKFLGLRGVVCKTKPGAIETTLLIDSLTPGRTAVKVRRTEEKAPLFKEGTLGRITDFQVIRSHQKIIGLDISFYYSDELKRPIDGNQRVRTKTTSLKIGRYGFSFETQEKQGLMKARREMSC